MNKLNNEDMEVIERWAKKEEKRDVHENVLPDVPLELFDDIGTEAYDAVMELKENERRVLWRLLENCLLEEPLSNLQIGKHAGVDPREIPVMRNRARFGRALRVTVLNTLKGHIDEIVGHSYRQSLLGRSTATRMLMELCDFYNPVTRMMSMNVNVDANDMRGKPAEAVREEVVKEWKRMGWGKKDFDELWKEDE